MTLRSIQSTLSLLGLFVLAMLLWEIRSSARLLPGALYLCVSGYPSLFSQALVASLRMKERKGIPEPAAWDLHTRTYVLLLSAWQLALIGSLNMWPFGFPVSWVSVTMGYLLAGAFMIITYKLVAIADSSKQEGGSRPINYFGRPRPRWIFFCAFVYAPIGPLIIMSQEWADAKWCPAILQPPRIWLLLVALVSIVSLGLIFQRYRVAGRVEHRVGTVLAVGTLLVLVLATVGQIFVGYDLEMYLLSSITVTCMAASVYWLSRAREGGL